MYTAILFQAARTVGELLQEGEVDPRSAPSQSFNIFEDLSSAPKRGRPALLQVCKPTLVFHTAPVPAVDGMLDVMQVEPGSAPSRTLNFCEDLSGAPKSGRPALLQVSQLTLDFPAVDVSAAICKGRDSFNYRPITILPIIQKIIAHRLQLLGETEQQA